jgi:phosphate transport system substrate-binding protein
MFSRRLLSQVFVAFGLLALGCKGENPGAAQGEGASSPTPTVPSSVSLNGAGATFPFPLYSKWMAEYNRLNPNVKINYQSIGSGGGIRQIMSETVDFGASDAPMKQDEEQKAPRKLLHIPTTLGAVVLAYNLPEVTGLKLTPDTVTGIFLGKIKKWNDPALAADNPDAKLPAKDIAVVYRSDGSGTTSVFTGYLATVSADWKSKVGAGKSVSWPAGLGAKGNEGVTGQVKSTPGAIGYLELAYANQNKMSVALLKNKAGQFIEPKISAITAAASAAEMPETLHVDIVDTAGDAAYPISAYTYLLVYEDTKDFAKGDALAKFLSWAIHDGQKFAESLDYAPLPEKVVALVDKKLKTLKSGSKTLLASP